MGTREKGGALVLEGLVDLSRKLESCSVLSARCLKGVHGGRQDDIIGFRL